MNITTNISRLAKTALAVLALGAVVAPVAYGASIADDWYRDANRGAVDSPSVVADDWYRDATPAPTSPATAAVADDWYRDAPVAAPASLPTTAPVSIDTPPAPGGFDWGDFGIGAGSMVGLLALLAMLTLVGRTVLRGRPLGRT